MIGQTVLFAPESTEPLRRRVEIVAISAADARNTLERFHYLHRARVGRQLNYAILLDGICDGVITYAYPMMSAPLLGVPSDELAEFARLYLHKNVPHVASCAIGKSLRRVGQDWVRAFPQAKPLRLVVSWSDATVHSGTVYKASNFEWVKRSKGCPPGNRADSKRGCRAAHTDYTHDKDCWVYWLNAKDKKVAA